MSNLFAVGQMIRRKNGVSPSKVAEVIVTDTDRSATLQVHYKYTISSMSDRHRLV